MLLRKAAESMAVDSSSEKEELLSATERSGVNQPRRLADFAHCLRAARKLELFEDVVDVMLHRGDAEAELVTDFLVRKALTQKRQHFVFAASKRQIRIGRGRRLFVTKKRLKETPRYFRRHYQTSRRDIAQRLAEPVDGGIP